MEPWTDRLSVDLRIGPHSEPEDVSDARLASTLDPLFQAGTDTLLARRPTRTRCTGAGPTSFRSWWAVPALRRPRPSCFGSSPPTLGPWPRRSRRAFRPSWTRNAPRSTRRSSARTTRRPEHPQRRRHRRRGPPPAPRRGELGLSMARGERPQRCRRSSAARCRGMAWGGRHPIRRVPLGHRGQVRAHDVHDQAQLFGFAARELQPHRVEGVLGLDGSAPPAQNPRSTRRPHHR